MSSMKRPGQPLRLKASEITKAIRAGELLDQLPAGGGPATGNVPALKISIRNGHATDLPAYGFTRWFGDPLEAATYGGRVPDLVLRTSTTTTHSIGVVRESIKATSGIGSIQVMGVCWARCRGPITANDALMPDSSWRGIKDTSGNSNIKALAAVAGSTDAIIPVLIGGGGGASCAKKFQLFVFWNPASGSFSFPFLAKEKDGDGVRSGSYFSETITIPYNATVTQTKTALESHTKIDAGEITVTGSLNLLSGPHTIILPEGVSFGSGDGSIDSSGLARSGLVTPYAYLSECCS